jgi:integrase
MPKDRKGFVVKKQGKLYARICYTDEQGKSRELMRRAVDREDARRILKQLNEELDQPTELRKTALDSARMTFAELADLYKQTKLTPAQYHTARKIGGMRSYKSALSFLKALVEFFGKQRIREITANDLESYRLLRLRTPTKRGVRSITSVNRELGLLRAMLNHAKRCGFLSVNPFNNAPSGIISPSDETKRSRVLSREEEARLLSVCIGKREHLHACIIAAIDTGLRKNELFTLVWSDVFLLTKTIRLRAFNSKTAKSRTVPITDRLAIELERLKSGVLDDTLVFTCGDVKRSFTTACRLAGIEDLRFHDLRHTFATRLAQAGIPLTELARLLGHSSLQMTFRYSNATAETVTRAASILNSLNCPK